MLDLGPHRHNRPLPAIRPPISVISREHERRVVDGLLGVVLIGEHAVPERRDAIAAPDEEQRVLAILDNAELNNVPRREIMFLEPLKWRKVA